jgi:hypothetical protein
MSVALAAILEIVGALLEVSVALLEGTLGWLCRRKHD